MSQVGIGKYIMPCQGAPVRVWLHAERGRSLDKQCQVKCLTRYIAEIQSLVGNEIVHLNPLDHCRIGDNTLEGEG